MANLLEASILNRLEDSFCQHIFRFLDLDELWNVRLISKRFYCLVKSYDFNELCFLKYGFDNKFNWFSTTKTNDLNRLIDSAKFNLLANPPRNFLNIKFLKLKEYRSPFFSLNILNRFTKLQILELPGISINSQCLLKLPDLKAFSIKINLNNSSSLNIDTPMLHSLNINNYSDLDLSELITVVHPQTVRYLKLVNFEKIAKIFSFVERIDVDNFNTLTALENLNELKHLKKVCAICGNIDDLKLRELYRRFDQRLVMVLKGVLVKSSMVIEDYIERRPNSQATELTFQQSYYLSLDDDLYFITMVDHNQLMPRLPEKEPYVLFRKYTNIKTLKIKDANKSDEVNLIYLIRESPNLGSLEIKNSSLSQEFYDQLHVFNSFFSLEIQNGGSNLDSRFILKMSHLFFCVIDLDFVVDENLKDLKYLEILKFKTGNAFVNVSKAKDKYFMAYNYLKTSSSDKGIDLDSLINMHNQLKISQRDLPDLEKDKKSKDTEEASTSFQEANVGFGDEGMLSYSEERSIFHSSDEFDPSRDDESSDSKDEPKTKRKKI